MSQIENPLTAKQNLRQHPTRKRWKREINRILYGDREDDLIHLGSVEQYVEGLLIGSQNEGVARAAFEEALSRVVQSWNTDRSEPDSYIERMLDLIGAYTPPEGFIKSLACLRDWRDFQVARAFSPGRQTDLYHAALVALENYYPTPPLSQNEPGFKAYTRILENHLLDPDLSSYSGYAARRLIELETLKLDDLKIAKFIYANPGELDNLVALLLHESRSSTIRDDLGQLYIHCMRQDSNFELMFEQALNRRGASIERLERYPVVIRGMERINLKLPDYDEQLYLALMAERGQSQFMKLFFTAGS